MYAWDDGISSDEDGGDSQEVLFQSMSSKDDPSKYEKGYMEDIYNITKEDFEGEFMCAREEIKTLKKKNHSGGTIVKVSKRTPMMHISHFNNRGIYNGGSRGIYWFNDHWCW